MPYSASLEFLYALQKHGMKLGLETIESLLARLGRPQERYRTFHIAGTNGKGSTAALTAAVLQAAGYRVGLYTSPHLMDFRERIRVDGESIPADSVTALTERLRHIMGATLGPTFFEFVTAMAFQFFADASVDVAVVEVGLGGRYDATNVLTPQGAVITNIALDHLEHLGTTIGDIAFEKAGIIKEGIPLVTGRLVPEAESVIGRIALERRAPWYRWGVEFQAVGDSPRNFRYDGLAVSFRDLDCPLEGAHQLENAACALAALEMTSARGVPISEEDVRTGLRLVRWEGRLEVVERNPLLLLDGAHNPAAALVVADYLAAHRRAHPESRIILVWGMMRDKDRLGFLHAILPAVDEVVVTQAQVPRAASVQELSESLTGMTEAVHLAPLPGEALARARRLADPEDLICVTGSLMLVGEVTALLHGCKLSPLRG